MDVCALCRTAVNGTYYRFQTDMVCAPCGEKLNAAQSSRRAFYLARGILFAFIAACLAAALRWIFEAFATGSGDTVATGAVFLRFFVLMFMAVIIGAAARTGARGRGGLLLQITSSVFMYLASTLALCPIFLSRLPPSKQLTPSLLLGAILFSLIFPFFAVTKNLFAITGIIVTGMAIIAVWRQTEQPRITDGPFDNTVKDSERPMFSSLS